MEITLIQTNSKFKKNMQKIHDYIKETEYYAEFYKKKSIVLFLSIGYDKKRSTIVSTNKLSFEQAWKNIYRQADKLLKNETDKIVSLKVDWIDETEIVTIPDFIKTMTQTKKNYFRKGISFDRDFKQAFLEQEINGNAMIQIDQKNRRGYLAESNIQKYVEKHRPGMNQIDFKQVLSVTTFTTKAVFFENNECYLLKQGEYDNGRRDVVLDTEELKKMIISGQDYLSSLNKKSGKFVYGYFSCFDKEINYYNMLRHASTLYAMIESAELFSRDALTEAIERGLDYLANQGIKEDKDMDAAYVIEEFKKNHFEIKLGANAAAILAFTKYMEVFQDDKYLLIAQKLAKGILNLQNEKGNFIHVLHYPSLEIKESFRIIYYDGEAAFALMRLYHLDKNEAWINAVERAFEHFIKNDYWKNHDHWLSYCTNELTRYRPLKKYFKFGLQNIHGKLGFIYNRKTTYPTFLELTLAADKMVQRLKNTKQDELLNQFDMSELRPTIHQRAEYQRNGYFYPELAMYYKNPSRITGSFFIRHHSFRSRIDDVEHYLSGYCQYYHLLMNE